MNESNVIELAGRVKSTDPLTELLRSGARQLLQEAIEAEVQELLATHSDRILEDGRAGVRNGHLPARAIQTGIGPVTVQIPKVRAKTGEPVTFHSALVPPYVRKTEVLLKLKSRGMNVPQLAIGDGAMGFWAALEEVYPESRQQRYWVHKTMNVLNGLPKSLQSRAKQALHEIWQANTREEAEKAFDLFLLTYEPKYPKAALCLQKDRDELMAFYSFPAQHWQSIRTSNPIESAFGTIRHRTKRSKGCLSRDGMLHMMFKLGMCTQQNWRRQRGFNYLAKVITGVKFKDGIEVTESNQVAA